MMASSFHSDPPPAKGVFQNPSDQVVDIPFPTDETHIASTSRINPKPQFRPQTNFSSSKPRSDWHNKESNQSNSRMNNLLMVVLRGLPGSGKSSLARDLVSRAGHGVVLSSDDYFLRDGEYEWRQEDLGRAHDFNQDRAGREMEKRTGLVVIDNTNVTAWEMRVYVEMGVRAGYEVKIMEPNTPWKWDVRELERRNGHGVDGKTIENMKAKFERGLEIGDLMERWNLDKESRRSGGVADSCGFSFEPLPDAEEDQQHFQSRINSYRKEDDHHNSSRWDQQVGDVESNLSQTGPPPNVNWSLIKEGITAFPGLTPNRNPFDGRIIPALSAHKQPFVAEKPTPTMAPFKGNSPSFDVSQFGLKNAISNVLPFGDRPIFGEILPNSGYNHNKSIPSSNGNNQSSDIQPFGNNKTISPFEGNIQSSGILPFGGSNPVSNFPPFLGMNTPTDLPPFCSKTPTPEIPFYNKSPTPEIPFFNKTPTPDIPLLGSGDANGTKKKSRWKQLAASFSKTEEASSSESIIQPQLDAENKEEINLNRPSPIPTLIEQTLPNPKLLEQILPNPQIMEEILSKSKMTEELLPHPKRMEETLATSRSKSIRRSMEEMLPTPSLMENSDLNTNDSLKSTDTTPEETDDTKTLSDLTDSSLKMKVSPKSKVGRFNIFKPVKLPSAFSFLQMDSNTKTNKTTEEDNASSCDDKSLEISQLKTPLDSEAASEIPIYTEYPPLPPPPAPSTFPDTAPPLPFDLNDPEALPPPPPSPSVILLPPLPPSPSCIELPNDLPPIPPPVAFPPDELNTIPQPPPFLRSEACAVEDIPIPQCPGFNFSIAGVQQSKVSRIGINNPNSFGALMMARKRIKENKNIFKEEDEDSNEVCHEDDDKNSRTVEHEEISPKHEPTSIGVIDNKRRATEKVKLEESEETAPIIDVEAVSKTTCSDVAQQEKTKSSMESDIDDIFPISKDGYGAAKQLNKVKKSLINTKQASKKVSESNDADIECLTPVDPKILCKIRASKVLTSLGNPTSELVTPAKDIKNDEPKKVPVLYGGYVTKLENEDELKTFTTNTSNKSNASEIGHRTDLYGRAGLSFLKKDRSRSRGRRSRSPKYSRSKSMKKKENRSRSRSRSRSHSSGSKKRSKKTRSRSRSSKRSKRTRSRSRIDSSRRKDISRSQSRSDRYLKKRQSKRTRSRSRSNSLGRKRRSKRSPSRSKRDRKSKSKERSSKSRKHKKMKSKKSKHKSKTKQRKEKHHHRKHSQSDEDSESETLEEKDTDVKTLEDDVESLENKIKTLEQAKEASESEGTNRSKQSSPTAEKENQLRRIRSLPLPKECSNSESEDSPRTPELPSLDSPKTPKLASEDSDDTICGKSSGEEETWEELKQKWEEKLKTKQKN